MKHASYGRFFAMIATSTVIMFILMYTTVYTLDHVWWSQTKFWMALYMGAMMAIVMLAFMLGMYKDKTKNIAIFAGSAVLFAAAMFFARSQVTVGDVSWMKAMIPHHSIAILTSERANISDPRVRRLADNIIRAQREEISEMEALIADLEAGGGASGPDLAPSVPPAEGGDEPTSGAPSVTVGERRGDVLVLDRVAVDSDAWAVVHPASADGSADAGRVLGRAFVMHGATERVPVTLAEPASGPLVVMLHDDTGEIGRYEFTGPGSPDQPLLRGGRPVTATAAPNAD